MDAREKIVAEMPLEVRFDRFDGHKRQASKPSEMWIQN